MFAGHVTHVLVPYCLNALSETKLRSIAQHLEDCPQCRQDYERVLQAHYALESLPLHTAPETLWNRIETELLDDRKSNRLRWLWPVRALNWRMRRTIMLAGMAAAFVALLIAGKNYLDTPSWQVRKLAGAPVVGLFPMGQTGRLRVGQWLTTDPRSKAEIAVADIGKVTIEPSSRVRLLETGKSQHRLELAEGGLDAKVTAPPRLFVVDTKAARAVDLGCAYHLAVDPAGTTLLRVATGEVELEDGKRDTLVIAGASCETRPGVGQGTPVMDDAPAEFKQALRQFDLQGSLPAVELALTKARLQDSLSLWHLLPVVPEAERMRVYSALANFCPPPGGVTQSGILHLDTKMMKDWRDDIVFRQITAPLHLGPF